MDNAINLPVSRYTIRWTAAPVLDRHAGQPETDRVTGRWAHSQRNRRDPARLTFAGDRNTRSLFAGTHIA
jgi:hypothetical protein